MNTKIRSFPIILANVIVLTGLTIPSSSTAQTRKNQTPDEDQVVTMTECEGAGDWRCCLH